MRLLLCVEKSSPRRDCSYQWRAFLISLSLARGQRDTSIPLEIRGSKRQCIEHLDLPDEGGNCGFLEMAPTAVVSEERLPARKYRSRKQKPCDNCRRRRVCCVRDAEGDCALCSRRSIPCTFSSMPSPRKRQARSAGASADAQQGQGEAEPTYAGGDEESHVAVDATPNAPSEPKGGGGEEGKYIGLTGTDDVYFAVDRFHGLGNDPAHEAYFRVRSG